MSRDCRTLLVLVQNGDSPMTYAAKYGHEGCLLVLLQKGGRVNIQTKVFCSVQYFGDYSHCMHRMEILLLTGQLTGGTRAV